MKNATKVILGISAIAGAILYGRKSKEKDIRKEESLKKETTKNCETVIDADFTEIKK